MSDVFVYILRAVSNALIGAFLWVVAICSGHELYDLWRKKEGRLGDVFGAVLLVIMFVLSVAAILLISGKYTIWG